MKKETYTDLETKSDKSAWERNVLLLHDALEYDWRNVWNKALPLLPEGQPTPNQDMKIPELQAILEVREGLLNRGGFAFIKESRFGRVQQYDNAWGDAENYPSVEKEHPYDPFDYQKTDQSELTLICLEEGPWKGHRGTFLVEIDNLDMIYFHMLTVDGHDRACYVNELDYFFTDLVWRVLSGEGKGDAFEEAEFPELLFAFADCGSRDLSPDWTPERVADELRNGSMTREEVCDAMRNVSK